MKVVVTGSSGHLGEALVRTLRARGDDVVGIDLAPSATTTVVGSIGDRAVVCSAFAGADAIVHAATLHKPHVATFSKEAFVEVNVTGTLVLLEEAARASVGAFVFTSTTSTFGDALSPPPDAPAAWIDEDVAPVPKNIYGVTKVAAESLCELFHRRDRLACLVLRTSRFFPEDDDDARIRERWSRDNAQTNEMLYRRADIEDMVSAHLAAIARAPALGFGRYIVSASTPFSKNDLADLRRDAPRVVARLFPGYELEYARRGWTMFPSIDRVYDNARARRDLAWEPRHDFRSRLESSKADADLQSALARSVGAKGYRGAS